MKLSKFLSIVSCITFFSILYVYQQTEIFRLAYIGQKKSITFQDFLDKNTILRYNINADTSLIRLDNKISEYANFQMPDNYRLVRLTPAKDSSGGRDRLRSLKRENIISILFGIKRQAEAKTP